MSTPPQDAAVAVGRAMSGKKEALLQSGAGGGADAAQLARMRRLEAENAELQARMLGAKAPLTPTSFAHYFC